jgi:hypothetical protein
MWLSAIVFARCESDVDETSTSSPRRRPKRGLVHAADYLVGATRSGGLSLFDLTDATFDRCARTHVVMLVLLRVAAARAWLVVGFFGRRRKGGGGGTACHAKFFHGKAGNY